MNLWYVTGVGAGGGAWMEKMDFLITHLKCLRIWRPWVPLEVQNEG